MAVYDVRRFRLTAGEWSVVIGAGPVGLLIAMVARATGAICTGCSGGTGGDGGWLAR